MKNILIALCLFCTISQIQAQEPDPQLFDTTWYLNQLKINDVESPIPSNDEVSFIPLQFSDGELNFIATSVCLSPEGSVVINENSMSIDSLGILIDDESCEEKNNLIFEGLYLGDFFNIGLPEVSDPIAYEILTDADGNLQLTLTNSNGDIAIYGDVLLNVQNQELTLFTISPNPVDDELQLNFSGNTLDATITVYDALGSVVYSNDVVTSSTTSLNLAHLQSGLYFVQVAVGNQRSVQKFVKR